ncbi:MAG: GNAT family N-acetyltransferase [Candidatus Omnitrophica bacterium]|nr:GNAT family N-acetyltransferase [Candidatus Omnitrophota bacterium]
MEDSNFKIRKLRKTDTEKLYKFFNSLSEKTKYFFHPHPFDRKTAENLCSEKKKNVLRYVLIIDDKIAGYGFLWDLHRDFPSLGICISDDFHGKGLGKILLDYLINFAKSKNKKGLCLTVYNDNEKALNLYKKVGFEIERIIYSMKLKF